MKKQFPFFLLVLVALSTLTQAQDYAFKVLVNKGNNEIKIGNAWQLIKTGATLKANDEVKLVDNAYLGLIHASGKPLEIKQAGNYKVADLAGKISGGASVINKYTDFILSSNTQKKNKLSATGAVHRGGNTTKIFLPKSELASVYGDTFILDWEKEKAPTTYVLTFKSMFGDELLVAETSEKNYLVDLKSSKFNGEDNIIIEIFPKGKPERKTDPPYVVKRLSVNDKNRINSTMAEIANQTSDNSPLSKLILAGFFEQNKLFIDAGTAYQEAVKLAPDIQEYQDAYNNFLLRNGMKEDKK